MSSTGGQLNRPTTVLLPPGTAKLALGQRHSVAVTADGALYSWGATDQGLGDATRPTTGAIPAGVRRVPLPGDERATAIAADAGHTLVLTASGSVFAWGRNDSGQLGDGTTSTRTTPGRVLSLPPVAAIATGARHSIAITIDGKVYTWGANNYGQLGVTGGSSRVPQLVTLPAGAMAVEGAGGLNFTAIRTADGRVLTWGANSSGQLGNGTTTASTSPVLAPLPEGQRAARVAAGNSGVTVMTTNGGLFAWGADEHGQVGDGTRTERTAPVPVQLPTGMAINDISRSADHTVAVTTDGKVLTWGQNNWGQLGDGTTTDRSAPAPVSLPAGETVRSIAAGFNQDIVLVESGPPQYLTVRTLTPVVSAGTAATFIVDGFDSRQHWLGPLTTSATLDLEGGTCAGPVCTGNEAGEQAVTARTGDATGRGFIRVVAATTSTSTPPPTTPTSGSTTTSASSTAASVTTSANADAATTSTATSPATSNAFDSAAPTTDHFAADVAAPLPSPTGPKGPLSYTGVGSWLLPTVIVGAIALTVGTILLLLSRRRRRHAPSFPEGPRP